MTSRTPHSPGTYNMKSQPTRVMCVDDNQLVADALQRRVDMDSRFEWAGWVARTHELADHVTRAKPNVLLLDIDMPGPDPFAKVQEISRSFPDLRVLMFSAYINLDFIDRAVASGAWGYVSKNESMHEVLDAIARAAAGEFVFTTEILASQQIKT